jgi:hypothetical protein
VRKGAVPCRAQDCCAPGGTRLVLLLQELEERSLGDGFAGAILPHEEVDDPLLRRTEPKERGSAYPQEGRGPPVNHRREEEKPQRRLASDCLEAADDDLRCCCTAC